MSLFTLDGNNDIMPNGFVMAIPEFKALWSRKYNQSPGDQRGNNRHRAKKELHYLYLMCDTDSEISQYPDSERHEEALKNAGLPPKHKISKELKAAREKYEKLLDSRELRLLRSAYVAVDKLQTYFDTIQVDDKNMKTYFDNLGKLGTVLDGLEKLEEQYKKKKKASGGIRGNAEAGFLDS